MLIFLFPGPYQKGVSQNTLKICGARSAKKSLNIWKFEML
jgi:hypothetical protein